MSLEIQINIAYHELHINKDVVFSAIIKNIFLVALPLEPPKSRTINLIEKSLVLIHIKS